MGDNPFLISKLRITTLGDVFRVKNNLLIDVVNSRVVCSAIPNIAIIEVPKGIRSIGGYAFCSSESLTRVTLPEGLVSIGDEAFAFCSNLTSITLPEGLASIGDEAFAACRNLTSISLPASLSKIDGGVYEYFSAEDNEFKRIPCVYTVPAGSYAETWAKEQEVQYEVVP